MSWDTMVPVALVLGLFGLVILVLLWPGERQGRRLLRRWGVDHPSDGDITDAVRYLKRRRFWYPWLFFLLPALGGILGLSKDDSTTAWSVAWTVLIGGLLGEVLALRPARGEHRQASLVRRRVVDLVPAWALVLLGIATAGGVLRYGIGHRWVALGLTVACALVAVVIVALAVERPAAGDPTVDLVLRTRSARVATGLAIAVPSSLPELQMSFPKALVFVLSLVALLAVVGPVRRTAATVG
ncbi:MAG TPA: hypothetical protein VFG87_02690 [Amycolatopsis sp.]|jgi:hypothetical protein|nr:hypothetical protein [Amycolatopsis sp.]